MSGRSYGQFCGLARALDVVGDRWSLLIVRELLFGPQRYGELAAVLDGIATNLLADRLRSLESAGVVERRVGETSGIVYALTAWGRQLREPIEAFVRWSAPLMVSGRGGDVFEPRWLAIALEALLRGRTAAHPAELGVEVPGLFLTLRISEDGPQVTIDPDQRPHTVLEADPELVLGVAAGAIPLDHALARASVHGDPRIVQSVLVAGES
jgi:DNA-binding HxlR family transcriptional regulator